MVYAICCLMIAGFAGIIIYALRSLALKNQEIVAKNETIGVKNETIQDIERAALARAGLYDGGVVRGLHQKYSRGK